MLAVGVHVVSAQYGSDTAKSSPGKSGAAKSAAPAKAGGAHTMTGCLAKGTEPNTYLLTQIEGNGPKQAELINVPANLNLDAHIGHKVAITGSAVNAKAAARMERGEKKTAAAERKEEAGEHHMKPTAVKMIASSCS
jgi:hypothetical protein